MLMILPEPCLSMCRPACCIRRKTLVRFTSITASQSSSEYSAAGARRIMPALLTRISIAPKCPTVSSTSRAQTSGKPTSPTSATAFAPAASILCCVALGAALEPCTATLAPACASATAMAAPSPRDEPVTRAVLPLRLNLSSIDFSFLRFSFLRFSSLRGIGSFPGDAGSYYCLYVLCPSHPEDGICSSALA